MTDKHIVSLELSKQLKEAGYKQEGEFWWVNHWRGTSYIWDLFTRDDDDKVNEHIVAPLASEIMERLPANITIQQQRKGYWHILFRDKLRAQNDKIYNDRYDTKADTPCNALAKMYLYLAKEKLL